MQVRQIIGLDVGINKTGLARASTAARLAEPLKTVATAEILKNLEEIIGSEDIAAIVVGLPRGLDGQETDQTRWVRDWRGKAKDALPGIRFYWQDEALTSKLASSQNAKNVTEDALAASIILQDFLDSNEEAKKLT